MQDDYKEITIHRGMQLSLEQLNGIVAPDGVIRVGSRLSNHPRLDHYGTPAIFRKDDPFSQYYMTCVHEEELDHTGGYNRLMAVTGEQLWIIGGSSLAKEILGKCPHCLKRQIYSEQLRIMPPLHETRIPEGSKPTAFSEIGIDLYGPYRVRILDSPPTRGFSNVQKRWILLISCCWTRAVNLLVVKTENTKSTSMALDRHAADYGTPSRVNCDGGGNFQGVQRDQREQWQYVQEAISLKRIEWPTTKWYTNPPYSPRFGGHFESMVKIGRRTMMKLLDHYSLLNDEELETIVVRTKSHMNSRPLNAVSPDPRDPRPLTPNDFLTTGKRYRDMVPIIEGEPTLTEASRTMRETLEKLWKIFYQEYVRCLHQSKHNINHRPEDFTVGQFVHLLSDTKQPIKKEERTLPGVLRSVCGIYRIGQIVEIHEGIDFQGQPAQRVFTVRTGDPSTPGQLRDQRRSYMTIAPLLI